LVKCWLDCDKGFDVSVPEDALRGVPREQWREVIREYADHEADLVISRGAVRWGYEDPDLALPDEAGERVEAREL
jgi:hypothetical protein